MKVFMSSLLFAIIFFGCNKKPSGIETSEQIKLTTDKPSYDETDSIHIFLENSSDSDLMIGLRCNEYLEMFYQEIENDHWSADKYFWYMLLGCPTFPDTIQANSIFTYSMPAEIFDTVGTFRLLIPCYVLDMDSMMTIISKSVEVR